MKEQLEAIRAKALEAVALTQAGSELEAVRVQYLGKKGELTAVLKQMGKLSPEERPVMGQLANDVRAALERAIEAQSAVLAEKALERKLEEETLDVTIPGKEEEKSLPRLPKKQYCRHFEPPSLNSRRFFIYTKL